MISRALNKHPSIRSDTKYQMSPKSKRRLRFDNFVYENSTSFVSDDEGFSRDKDGYGGTIIYECVHCDHKTRWRSALKRHFFRMHGLKPKKPILKPGEKLYECALCEHSTNHAKNTS